MKKIDPSVLDNAMSYQQYVEMTQQLLAEGKTTGPYQTKFMIEYTRLNLNTMLRLNEDFQLEEERLTELETIKASQKWLVITEPWCGDAGQVVPIINKIVEANEHLSLYLILRDENKTLMDEFLTNGTASIPKLVCLDAVTLEVLNTWGPRPDAVQDIVDRTKKEMATITDKPARKARYAQAQMEVQEWYNTDKAIAIQKELLDAILTKM